MMQSNPEFRSIKRVRSALVNAAVYRAISQVAGALTFVLLVRIMTEHNYGIYQLFYCIPAVMGAVLSLGIANALQRFLPEYFSRKDFAVARHLIRWSLRLRLLTTTLFLSLCLLFWEQIGQLFDVAELRSYFLIFAPIVLTHFQCRILTLALSANLMQQWSSGLFATFALVKLAGYFTATYVGVSLQIILIVDLIAYSLWYAGLRIVYYTRIPRSGDATKVRFSKEERRRVVRYAAFYNFNDVGVVALKSTADLLFIAAFMTPVAVGAYAFCTGLNTMMQRLTPIVYFKSVIQPLVFTLDYKKQENRAREYFTFLLKINYLVQFPIFVFVAAVPAEIISVIFAGKFIEYKYLLVAAFGFPAMYGFQLPVMMMAQLTERAGIILASKVFAAYNVAAAIVLIPIIGAYGAIVATGTAQLFKSLFVWFFVKDVATFRGTGMFFFTQIALWISCWATVTFVARDMADFWSLITAIIIVGLFAMFGVRFARFNNRESELIRRVSGTRVARVLEAVGIIRE
jgi:O-antigen/teichoic acid export membrane protein